MTPVLCLSLLEPEQYSRPLGVVTEGKRALTHLAIIKIDGKPRRCYVKAHRGCDNQPSRGLLNEIVGYTLAHHAGIPQPHGGLIKLASPQLHCLFPNENLPAGGASCFVSLEAHNPVDTRSGMAKALFSDIADLGRDLLGWQSLGAMLTFDAWTANIDRNTGNLIRTGPKQYAVIDHGDLLTGPCWLADELNAETPYPHKVFDHILPPDTLPLPVKSAILKKAAELWKVYRKAEPELSFWLGGQSNSDKLRAWHFLWKRIEWTEPHLRTLTRMTI